MLSASQLAHLENIVQRVHPELQLEAATLDAQQTLELVLCRDFVCFRPLSIRRDALDVVAALAGQEEAQRAMQAFLQTALHGLI